MAKPVLTVQDVLNRGMSVFRLPRVVVFNRLEGRPRTRDFTRSLRAEVRDPLWLLARQWQFGEFQGEDAASPVTSRIAYVHETMDRVAFDGERAFPYAADSIPLESRVERERIPLTVRETAAGRVFSDVLVAVQWGKLLLRQLQSAGLDQHYPLYLKQFPLRVLPDTTGGQPEPTEDPGAEEIRLAARGRVADGVAIWRAVELGTHDTWLDSEPTADASLKPIAAAFAASCSKQFARVFTQPEPAADSAWRQNHLEYQFVVAGPPAADGGSQSTLLAEQYHNGRLDWYSFDAVHGRKAPLEEERAPVALEERVESFLPANVRFRGQPQPRFWEMEETETNFGKIETSPTGLLHLILAEFGLIFSNDWFMLPHPMPINTVCEVRGIVVDDTFGRHTFIRPAGRGPETSWQRWAMFHQTERGQGRSGGSRFYLVPSVGKVLESEPLERVNFMRDEMANMVWGVERIVPSQIGQGISGYETLRPEEVVAREASEDENVKIRYVLGTTVPRNWIPFIAVHAEGSASEIRLQRARMVGGQPPRGWLLREPRSPYFVEEEEVPRTGVFVERSWQRARWLGGRTFVWVGRRKTAGRGEGWSQLVFDQVVDLPPREEEG
jgi:hypothetical protein